MTTTTATSHHLEQLVASVAAMFARPAACDGDGFGRPCACESCRFDPREELPGAVVVDALARALGGARR